MGLTLHLVLGVCLGFAFLCSVTFRSDCLLPGFARKGLDGIHDIFHVSHLCPYLSNGLSGEIPPVEFDGKLEYEVAPIKDHHVSHGEL